MRVKAPLGEEGTGSKWLIAEDVMSTLGIQKTESSLCIGMLRAELRISVVWNHSTDLGGWCPGWRLRRRLAGILEGNSSKTLGERKSPEHTNQFQCFVDSDSLVWWERRGFIPTYRETGNYLRVNGESLIQGHGIWARKWHDPSSVFWRLTKYHCVLDYLGEEVGADQDRSVTQLTLG